MTTQLVRVLAITRAYGTRQGGMERLSYELLEQLRQQPELEIKIIAYTGSRPGIIWFIIKATWFALWEAPQFDVVHLGDPLLAKIGWLVQSLYHKPVVVTVHGLDVLYPNLLYKLYLWLFFRHFAAYWPISHHARAVLQDTWHPTGTITVIQPGIHDQLYTPSYTRVDLNRVLQQELSSEQPVFLTTGRLVKRKGVAWFINEVLPHLPAVVKYIVVGTGPEQQNILQAVKDQQLEKQVILLGRVGDDDLKILYNTVDGFIQPNIKVPHDTEGFGLVLLEAASCARPVFAANLEGITDAIIDQQNGTLLPSGSAQAWQQALNRFLQQPSIWQPSGAAARQYILNQFSWNQQIKHYVQSLQQLVQR